MLLKGLNRVLQGSCSTCGLVDNVLYALQDLLQDLLQQAHLCTSLLLPNRPLP